MARSAFGRGLAAFGMAANIVGILGAAAPAVTSNYLLGLQLLAPPLIGLWSLLIGVKFYRNSRNFASLDGPG